jgi:hypothetical protein
MGLEGYELGTKIGTDIASKDILQQAYQGADMSNMSPADQQGALSKASMMANARGLNSLAYKFQKEAQEVGKDNADQQAAKLKAQQGKLELAGQYAAGATDVSDLRKAYEMAGADPAQKLYIEGILNRQLDADPAKDLAMKKQAVQRMGATVNQDLTAQLKLLHESINQQNANTREQNLLDRERRQASREVGKDKTDKTTEKTNAELDRLDRAESNRVAQIETNPYITDKEEAKKKVREEYEANREKVKARRGGTAKEETSKESTKSKTESKFVEGKIYEDAKGNKARYVDGNWVPVK